MLPDWAAREPDEPLADWMLRLQISRMAAEPRPAPVTLTQAQVDAAYAWADRFMTDHMRFPAPAGRVIFRHDLTRNPYTTSGGSS